MRRYAFDFSNITIADAAELEVVFRAVGAGDRPMRDALDLMQRYASFDIDSEPITALAVICDDFGAAVKKQVAGHLQD